VLSVLAIQYSLNEYCTVLYLYDTEIWSFLADRTACSMIGYWYDNVVCLSVCLSVCDAVIVIKRYIAQQKYLNK